VNLSSYYRRGTAYWRLHGTGPFIRAVLRRVKTRLVGAPPAPPALAAPTPPSAAITAPRFLELAHTPADLEYARFPSLRGIRTFMAPGANRRVTVVTDSVGRHSLFGGVGTALLLGAHLANRLDAQLRLVTRTERPSPTSVEQVLSAYGVRLLHEPQFHYAHVDDAGAELDVVADEVFLTTSWWSTTAMLKGVKPSSIVYLLQEDERMFYPFGDDRLRCEGLLSRDDIQFVVNTRLLLDHLTTSGLGHLADRALSFEPAFPANVFHKRVRQPRPERKRFFFYARPHNERNLFQLGVQVLDKAIQTGVLAPDQWELVLIGRDVPRIDFGPDVLSTHIERLDWSGYAEFCGGVDLALSLMYTPHPSYPPLDLAASGAVVVTNRFGNKQDLSGYSRNILCADLEIDSLVEGLRAGVALVDSPQREQNYRANALQQDWAAVFEPVLRKIQGA
jgi:hypothetical protein